jgi:hypothetical protein
MLTRKATLTQLTAVMAAYYAGAITERECSGRCHQLVPVPRLSRHEQYAVLAAARSRAGVSPARLRANERVRAGVPSGQPTLDLMNGGDLTMSGCEWISNPISRNSIETQKAPLPPAIVLRFYQQPGPAGRK